ncbi:hypothetical protein GPK34_00490 [Secundilactobacillus kimchicus]|uniref:hypothetical protein n=1 Tax=Secundilactobacillus kimchicus TaxID=528209 RepID=UPI001C01E07C|nr:hypothetical protein [Secundilactobacillus kimchicus]MBT9670515.1 hypothetical protein [Secundilactobacillus kimchicus]
MKYLMAQPAVKRYEFEVATAVDNLLSMGVAADDIVLLFSEENYPLDKIMREKFHVQTYVFKDTRIQEAKDYVPSIRPYLWWQFLKNFPEMTKETFMYQDADVIYRSLPKESSFTNLSANHWYAADTESYTGVDYTDSKGRDLVKRMAEFLGITEAQFRSFRGHGVGAQWVIKEPTEEYWLDVYQKSYELYTWLNKVEHEYDCVLQKNGGQEPWWFQVWTAEMFAELYLCAKYGVTVDKAPELSFSWATDTIDVYPRNNILHNAGVTPELRDEKHLFFKGDYTKKSPFDADLTKINPEYCSRVYVDAITRTRRCFR